MVRSDLFQIAIAAPIIAGTIVWFMVLSAVPVPASTFFVSRDGTEKGDGSSAKPWPSVEYALSRCGGGNTINLKPGIYFGGFRVSKQYGGTAARPTIVKSEIKWRARIVGAEENAVMTDDDAEWIVIDGFEVTGALYDGVKFSGPNSTVRNCWIHNNGQMGCGSHGHDHNTFENNLIEYNGQNFQKHHGIYADGDGLIVRNNIVRHNSGYGLHLYPSLSHSIVCNNLVYGHFYKSGILVQCPAGGGQNQIVNNTSVDNVVALDIRRGNNEIAVNNLLIVRNGDPVTLDGDTTNIRSDYNLCSPQSSHNGPHGVTGDPGFLDKSHQCYWLGVASPAIGKGTRQYAPATDFWGRPAPSDASPDLGCFAFRPGLTLPDTRSNWPFNVPYRFQPLPDRELPDPWDPHAP